MVRYTIFRIDCPNCGKLLRRGVPRFGPKEFRCKQCGTVTQTGLESWDSFSRGEKTKLAILEFLFPSWIGIKGCEALLLVPLIQMFFWVMCMAPFMVIGTAFQKSAPLVFVIFMFLGMFVYPVVLAVRLRRLIKESRSGSINPFAQNVEPSAAPVVFHQDRKQPDTPQGSTVPCEVTSWEIDGTDINGSFDPYPIAEEFRTRLRQHFVRAGMTPGETGARYQIRGKIVRMDQGNRFLRYFLTGLGQVVVEAEGEICAGERVVAALYSKSKYGGLHFFGGAAEPLLVNCAGQCAQQIGKQAVQAIHKCEQGILPAQNASVRGFDSRKRTYHQWQANCETRLKHGEPVETLRQEMLQDGYSPADASAIVNAAIQAKNNQTFWIFGCSALLFFGGIMVTYATYSTATSQGGGAYFLWFGAIICGVIGFLYGLSTLRKTKPASPAQRQQVEPTPAARAEIEAVSAEVKPLVPTPVTIVEAAPVTLPEEEIPTAPSIAASFPEEPSITATVPDLMEAELQVQSGPAVVEAPEPTPEPVIVEETTPPTPPEKVPPVTFIPAAPPSACPPNLKTKRETPLAAWLAIGAGVVVLLIATIIMVISGSQSRSKAAATAAPALALHATSTAARSGPTVVPTRVPTLGSIPLPPTAVPTVPQVKLMGLPVPSLPALPGSLSPQNLQQIQGLAQTNETVNNEPLYCRQLAWSNDSQRLAMASNNVHIYDFRTRKEAVTITGLGWVNSIIPSQDGTLMLVSSDTGGIQLWDPANNKELRDYTSKSQVHQKLAISPDGKTLAATKLEGGFTIYEIETGDILQEVSSVNGPNALAFSPDGKVLAGGGADLTLWDAQNGQVLLTNPGHERGINDIAFSPDGRILVTAAADIKVWDAASGTELLTLNEHKENIDAIDFSPDGRLLASLGRDKKVFFYDMSRGVPLGFLNYESDVPYDVRFSPDGTMVSACGMGGPLVVWGLPGSKAAQPTVTWAAPTPTTAPAYAPMIKKLSMLEMRAKAVLLAYPRADLLLIGGYGLSAYNPLTAESKTITENNWLYGMVVSPDGSRLATAEHEKVTLSGVDGQNALAVLKSGDQQKIAFSPDGKTLAVAINQAVKLFDTTSGEELNTLPVQTYAQKLAFSPDGTALVILNGMGVSFYDMTNGSEIKNFQGHAAIVNTFAFSPDGSILAVAGSDDSKVGKIVLWDVASGQWLRTLTGHNNRLNDVTFSPDGRWLASASEDLTVRVWDAASGDLLNTLTGHTEAVNSVVFSPGQDLLVSAANDGVIFWKITSQ